MIKYLTMSFKKMSECHKIIGITSCDAWKFRLCIQSHDQWISTWWLFTIGYFEELENHGVNKSGGVKDVI